MTESSATQKTYRREDISRIRTTIARSRRRCQRRIEGTLGRSLPFAWREFILDHPGRSLLFALGFGTFVGLGRKTAGSNSSVMRAWQTISDLASKRVQGEFRQLMSELRRRRQRDSQDDVSDSEQA